MINEEMEILLRRAGEGLPKPAKCAPRVENAVRRPVRMRRIAAFVAVLILCSVTVGAATLEVPIPDSSGYSQWTGFPGNPGKYGLKLENAYGEYVLSDQNEMWVIPQGATYLEALFDATYRAISVDYCNDSNGGRTEEWGKIRISAGGTDNPYWRAYFSMDELDIPTSLHDMTVHIYRDYTLYCGEYRSQHDESTWLYIKWVDYDRGYVYSISFYGAMEDREAALEFAKMLIDGMR